MAILAGHQVEISNKWKCRRTRRVPGRPPANAEQFVERKDHAKNGRNYGSGHRKWLTHRYGQANHLTSQGQSKQKAESWRTICPLKSSGLYSSSVAVLQLNLRSENSPTVRAHIVTCSLCEVSGLSAIPRSVGRPRTAAVMLLNNK